MKHLLDATQDWEKTIKASHLLLFMDYDGTLAPIVDHPEEAILSPQMRKMLESLSGVNRINTAIVTGRSLEQVKAFVGLPNLIYVGSHGLEIEGFDIKYTHPGALEMKPMMKDIAGRLKNAFADVPGIVVEEKNFTVSIHYRHVKEADLEKNRLRLLNIIYPYLEKSQIILSHAIKVWELKPAVEWNKASAMLWLSGHLSASIPYRSLVSMYIGDDEPDEVCFKIMRHGGFGVRITENPDEPTRADYYLRNTNELYQFMQTVQNLKTKS